MNNTNKKLQTLIGSIIGKDYFKLEFGCNVIVEGIANDNPGCEHDIVVDNRIKNNLVRLGYFGDVPICDIEIIGQEPTLNDVLLAIPEEKQIVIRYIEMYARHWIIDIYDLTKSLFNQSEETKVALINLLENK